MKRFSLWQVVQRREIVVIGCYLFITDLVIGAVASTLSLFAQGLGASLTLLGILATVLGLARFGVGIVIGNISDRRGRKPLLILGMALMGGAALFYAVTTLPAALLPINALFGMGFIACLTIGLASIGDITTTAERGLAYGLATTAMGFGFAVGAFIGGIIVGQWGYPAMYLITAGIAFIGCIVVWRGLPDDTTKTQGSSSVGLPKQLKVLMADRIILVACIGNVLSNLAFGGLILIFFPVYAAELGLTQATIGSMIATRSLASTLARLPGGLLSTVMPSQFIMVGTLSLAAIVAVTLVQVTTPWLLTLLLVGEGLSYGLFLTTMQATVSTQAGASRGAALGAVMAAASVGDSFIPLVLGPLADLLGVESVFYIVGTMIVVGMGAIIYILIRHERQRVPREMQL